MSNWPDGEARPLEGVSIEPAGFTTKNACGRRRKPLSPAISCCSNISRFGRSSCSSSCAVWISRDCPPTHLASNWKSCSSAAIRPTMRFTAENVRLLSHRHRYFALRRRADRRESPPNAISGGGPPGIRARMWKPAFRRRDRILRIHQSGRDAYVRGPPAPSRGVRHEAPERSSTRAWRRGVTGLHDTWVVLGGRAWEWDGSVPGGNPVAARDRHERHAAEKGPAGGEPRAGYGGSRRTCRVCATSTAPTLPLYPPTGVASSGGCCAPCAELPLDDRRTSAARQRWRSTTGPTTS